MHGRDILITILLSVSTSSSFKRPILLDNAPIKIMTIIETMIILKSIKSTYPLNKNKKIISNYKSNILNLVKIVFVKKE